jgi:hypothetical protein
MPVVTDLIQLSRFAGERFDLVQASGGNASLNTPDGKMRIKASGRAMSDIVSEDDLCELSCEDLLDFIEANMGKDLTAEELEEPANECLQLANRTPERRPSNETFLHALFGPLTLHTHPPVVTSIVCQRGWREKISTLIPTAHFVDYATPGPCVAIKMAEALKEANWKIGDRAIVFLQNHGMIISGHTASEVAATTNDVVARLSYFLGVEWSRYRLTNRISDLILSTTGDLVCTYLTEDRVLQDAVKKNPSILLAQPVFPDQVMYSGPAGLELTSLDDEKPLTNYVERYGQLPRVVLYRSSSSQLFIVAETMRRCREIEQVLKAHALTLLSASMPQVQFLPDDELIYLMNKEVEKDKQTV